jgi:outer membrane protein assembly factor BamA
MRPVSTVLLAVLLLVSVAAHSRPQTAPTRMRLAGIDATGLRRLSAADVIAGSGLRVGTTVTLADIDASVERLGKTGLFAHVSYRYRYKGEDLFVTFDVEEARAETRVVFDNFPWFSDEEIAAVVAKAVPGFTTHISDNAEGIERITAALDQMLRARKLPGRVEYIPYLDTRDGAHAHLFKVAGAPVPICDVAFKGVNPALLAQVRTQAAPLLTRDYSRIGSTDFLRGTLVPFYRRLGHLRVRLPGVTARMGEARCAGGVVLAVPVEEGAVYWWKGAVWAGAQALGPKELDAALGMQAGEVADGTKIDRGVRAVASAYGRKGYLAAHLTPAAQFDDLRHTVVFAIQIVEGVQFRMGELAITGVPDATARLLRERWKMKAGDVYDAGYTTDFMNDLRKSDPQLLTRLGAMRMSVRQDATTHTVQVTLAFGT